MWPKFYWHPQIATGEDLSGPAKLIALHLVWPWSKRLMKVLSPSVFCDATFKVTVYHYKLVVISTLDGGEPDPPPHVIIYNEQHRTSVEYNF